MNWDKDSLSGKSKAADIRKVKRGIHSPLPMDREVFSLWQESRATSSVTVTWEEKSLQMSFLSFFFCHTVYDLPPLSWAWCHMLWNIPLVSCSHLSFVTLCLCSIWCAPSLLSSVTVQKAEKAIALYKPCAAITRTSLYYWLYAQHKSKTQLHSRWKEKKN